MKKNDKQRLVEVMQRLDKTFKPKLNEDINSIETNDSYKKIKNEFPGHAKYVNPIDSLQYKWYQRVLNFIQGNNNVYEKEELIKFFQNYFLGMDYDILQTPAETVSWWLSFEQQEFIKDELNSEPKEMFSNLSENSNVDEFLPISTPIGGEDEELFLNIVNQGIDSHLEGFVKSKFSVNKGSLGNRRVFNFHKSEIPIVLRRLEEIGTEDALQWKYDIENYNQNLDEISGEINELNVNEVGTGTLAKTLPGRYPTADSRSKNILKTALNSVFSKYLGKNLPFFLKVREEDKPLKYMLLEIVPKYEVYMDERWNSDFDFHFYAENGIDADAPYASYKKDIIFGYSIKNDEYLSPVTTYHYNQQFVNFLIFAANQLRQAYFTANPIYTESKYNPRTGTTENEINIGATEKAKKSRLTKNNFDLFSYDSQNLMNVQ